MAGIKLPTYESDNALDVGSHFFRPPSDRGGQAVARGLSEIGEGIGAWSVALEAKNEKLANYQAEGQLLDLQARTSAQIQHESQNIAPDGKGFFKSNIDKIKSDAEVTLSQIPEHLRPQFEVKIKEFLMHSSDKLANMEITQGANYVKDVTTRKLDALSESVVNGLTDVPNATKDLDSFLTGADLPPNQTAALREAGLRTIEGSRLEFMRRTNPQGFMAEALKYMPSGPSDKAGPYQKMAIEQSLAAGIDPRVLLTIGNLESGFNPNAKASKTIFGIYQMSAAERSRLGIPESLKGDPGLQTAGMIRLVKENTQTLQRNGIEANPRNIWMMHFLGQGGALTFLRADPNADAYSVYASVAGPSIARQAFNGSNGKLLQPGMTVGQVLDQITRKVYAHQKNSDSYINQNSSPKDANAPLEIGGEKFSILKGGDLGGYFGKASIEVNKQIDQTFDGMAKQALAAGELNPYTSEGRKVIDKSVMQSGVLDRYIQNDPSASAEIGTYLKSYGYLPTPIAAAAAQKLARGTPEERQGAYDLLYTAHSTDSVRGLELAGVNTETKKRVEDYAALRSVYNYDPSQAAAYADKVNSADYKEKLAKIDVGKLNEAKKSLSWGQIESKLDLDSGWLWWRQNTTPPEAAKQIIMGRYNDRFEFYYRESGDIKLAQSKAIVDIARSHGTTELTPSKQFVLHPPENYYPADKDGKRTYFSDQLKEYVTHFVDDQATKFNDPTLRNIDPKKIMIGGSSDTGNDIQAGRYPRYEVFYVDHNNDLQMIPTPFTADPARGAGKLDVGRAGQKDETSQDNATVDIAAARQKANEDRERVNKARIERSKRGR